MKRSILLCNKNYWAGKGKASEDGYIRGREGNITIPENKKWKKYIKSHPKGKREKLERKAIQYRAREYEKYERAKHSKNDSKSARKQLSVNLEAGYREIALDEKLPNLVDNWNEKKEPKIWNSSAGGKYIRKWQRNCMTILDPNKNVITVQDADGIRKGKPKLNKGVVPFYAVVPYYANNETTSDFQYLRVNKEETSAYPTANEDFKTSSKFYFKMLQNKLSVPNADYEELFERTKPDEPVFERIKHDIFTACSMIFLWVTLYNCVTEPMKQDYQHFIC